jgi:hypothetical protein
MRRAHRPPAPRRKWHHGTATYLVACLVALVAPVSGSAQGIGTGDGMREGITFGGISTVGISVEYFHNQHSVDLSVGTWSFHDLSAAVTFKEYFGASYLHPFVGGGVWLVLARPRGERTGAAAVLQAPVGLDWRVEDRHYVGGVVNVNRALWVRRTDPEDNLPLNRRLVPLPGVYYRWSR